MLDSFLLQLFEKYAELLKRRFSEDFQEVSLTPVSILIGDATNEVQIVSTDDYMPLAINTMEEYEKVVNVTWFTQDKPVEELTYVTTTATDWAVLINADTHRSFPCVLPFSQMYPLCCIDIRNFLNQFYFFSNDHFQHPNVIDETLRKAR